MDQWVAGVPVENLPVPAMLNMKVPCDVCGKLIWVDPRLDAEVRSLYPNDRVRDACPSCVPFGENDEFDLQVAPNQIINLLEAGMPVHEMAAVFAMSELIRSPDPRSPRLAQVRAEMDAEPHGELSGRFHELMSKWLVHIRFAIETRQN